MCLLTTSSSLQSGYLKDRLLFQVINVRVSLLSFSFLQALQTIRPRWHRRLNSNSRPPAAVPRVDQPEGPPAGGRRIG